MLIINDKSRKNAKIAYFHQKQIRLSRKMLNFDRLQRHLTNPLTLTPNARAGGSGMPAYSRKGKRGCACGWKFREYAQHSGQQAIINLRNQIEIFLQHERIHQMGPRSPLRTCSLGHHQDHHVLHDDRLHGRTGSFRRFIDSASKGRSPRDRHGDPCDHGTDHPGRHHQYHPEH